MDQPQIPSEVPTTLPRATPRNIRKVHESLYTEFSELRHQVQHVLEEKLAVATDIVSGQEPTLAQVVLTDHQRKTLELCRLSDRMLASEAIFNQFKGKRVTKKTKLSTETVALWQKVIVDRPDLYSGEEVGDDETGGQDLDNEEYRESTQTPSHIRKTQLISSVISSGVERGQTHTPEARGEPTPGEPGLWHGNSPEPSTSTSTPLTSRKRASSKTDLRLLVPKRAKPEPRSPFKHITNALREEIVRDHITSGRGQAATVLLWKGRFPDLTITQSSLSRWIKNVENIQLANASGGSASTRSHAKHRVHYPAIDEEVGSMMLDMQDGGLEITQDAIRERYLSLCDERGIEVKARPKLSVGWMDGFVKRHNINVVDMRVVSASKRKGKAAAAEEEILVDPSLDEPVGGQRDQVGQIGSTSDQPGTYGTTMQDGISALNQGERVLMGYLAVNAANDAARGEGSTAAHNHDNDNKTIHNSQSGSSGDSRPITLARADEEMEFVEQLARVLPGSGDTETNNSDAQQLIRDVFEREQSDRRGVGGLNGEAEAEADGDYVVDESTLA